MQSDRQIKKTPSISFSPFWFSHLFSIIFLNLFLSLDIVSSILTLNWWLSYHLVEKIRSGQHPLPISTFMTSNWLCMWGLWCMIPPFKQGRHLGSLSRWTSEPKDGTKIPSLSSACRPRLAALSSLSWVVPRPWEWFPPPNFWNGFLSLGVICFVL